MTQFRMVVKDSRGYVEISSGSKEDLLESLKDNKNIVDKFVKISAVNGTEIVSKNAGEDLSTLLDVL